MIRSERECEVICGTCGNPAVRRQVEVITEHNGRMVVYDVHADSLHHADHQAALSRIEEFHDRLHRLEDDLRKMLSANPLKGCAVLRCDLVALRPTACEVRSEIVAQLDIQAWGLKAGIELPARAMNGQTAEQLRNELSEAAEPVKAMLKARHDSGEW